MQREQPWQRPHTALHYEQVVLNIVVFVRTNE
jgi:hypothetical protein